MYQYHTSESWAPTADGWSLLPTLGVGTPLRSIHFLGQPKQHQGFYRVRFSTRRQSTGRFFYFKFHRNSYSCKLKKALPNLSTAHGYPLDTQFLNCSASAVFKKKTNPSSSEIIYKAKVKICVFTVSLFCDLRHTHCISIQ